MKVIIEAEDKLICSECGSGDVESPAFINLKTGEVGFIAPQDPSGFSYNWPGDYCNNCDDEKELIKDGDYV